MTIIDKIKNPQNKQDVLRICKLLKNLEINGESRQFINQTIQDLELPISLHLFITGNYSELMDLKYS